jgi:hypothetical protein
MWAPTDRVHIPESIKREVACSQGWKCNACHNLLPCSFELDHIRPLHWGGLNHRTNYQVLCGTCHNEKSHQERQKDLHWEICPEDRPFEAFCMRCEECFSPYFGHECTRMGPFDSTDFDIRLYQHSVRQYYRKNPTQ